MIGTNDFINDTTVTVESVWKSYQKVIKKIKRKLPNCELFVQSLLPLHPKTKFYSGRNEKAEELNSYLSSSAEKFGYKYVEIASKLKDENGDLADIYTEDGIHLLPTGYLVWKEVILENLNR